MSGATLEEEWWVGVIGSSPSDTGHQPWWVDVAQHAANFDLSAAALEIERAPSGRPIGFRGGGPDLLAAPPFVIGAVGAALAVSPGVVIALSDE
jgi:hypothetical protein